MGETTVTVTPRAFRHIARITADEPEGTVLRVSVEGGGCSGFQYVFDLTRETQPDDLVITGDEGVTVHVDAMALPFLAGATLDYVEDLMGAGFQVNNPNATASCGCGTSFSIG